MVCRLVELPNDPHTAPLFFNNSIPKIMNSETPRLLNPTFTESDFHLPVPDGTPVTIINRNRSLSPPPPTRIPPRPNPPHLRPPTPHRRTIHRPRKIKPPPAPKFSGVATQRAFTAPTPSHNIYTPTNVCVVPPYANPTSHPRRPLESQVLNRRRNASVPSVSSVV